MSTAISLLLAAAVALTPHEQSTASPLAARGAFRPSLTHTSRRGERAPPHAAGSATVLTTTRQPAAAAPACLVASSPPEAPSSRSYYVGILFASCTIFSLVTDLLTKRVLKMPDAWQGLAITITFFHFAVSAVVGACILPILAWWRTRGASSSSSPPAAKQKQQQRQQQQADSTLLALLLRAWPLGLLQLGGFFCTNVSLKFVPVSFSHTVKACECLFTALLSLFIFGERLSLAKYLALVPTAGGVALSAMSEVHFNLLGFLAAMASNGFFAARSVFSARLMRGGAVDAPTLYWLLCCVATTALLPAAVAHGELWRLLEPRRLPLLLTMCACGAAHFTYNLLSFQILQETSPVTHVVLHAVRRILVIAAASTIAGLPLSLVNWCGIAVASGGVLTYAVSS